MCVTAVHVLYHHTAVSNDHVTHACYLNFSDMNEVFIGAVPHFSNQEATKTSSQDQLDKSDKGNNEKVKPKKVICEILCEKKIYIWLYFRQMFIYYILITLANSIRVFYLTWTSSKICVNTDSVFPSFRAQVRKTVRWVKSHPWVPRPLCPPPQRTRALAREKLVHLLEKVSSRSAVAKSPAALPTSVRSLHITQQLCVCVCVHSNLAHIVYCVLREVSCGADWMFMTQCDFLEDLSFYPEPLFIFSSHTHGVHFMDHNLQPTQPVVPI